MESGLTTVTTEFDAKRVAKNIANIIAERKRDNVWKTEIVFFSSSEINLEEINPKIMEELKNKGKGFEMETSLTNPYKWKNGIKPLTSKYALGLITPIVLKNGSVELMQLSNFVNSMLN